MTDFSEFSALVQKQFNEMSLGNLFMVSYSPDLLWEVYLDTFPEGTNPLIKERTLHDCNCCKQFLRNIGTVVSIQDGELITVWDVAANYAPYPFNKIADTLGVIVRESTIAKIFLKSEPQYGSKITLSVVDGVLKENNHFEAKLNSKHINRDPGPKMSETESAAQVLGRGLKELSISALDTVLDLIDSKSIYRAEEFKKSVEEFKTLKTKYDRLNSNTARANLIWEHINSFAARFRNSVIGTLVQDLSEGKDLEVAVRMYETKVAPANYKRPTSLITPGMIKDAVKTIDELGIAESLERRFANISDISINNVLYVDRETKKHMKDAGLSELLMSAVVPKVKNSDHATDISIADFMENIVPKISSISVQVKNSAINNLMSVTAPVHEDSPLIFKWDNRFAWSYNGNITDSIKEKVKRAGGNVTSAKLRVSLAWFNTDDLDIHVRDPKGNHIYFGDKMEILDVDMNVGYSLVRDPVENLSWKQPADGVYSVSVNNYSKRENVDHGFDLEVESNGKIEVFSYPKSVSGTVSSLTIKVVDGGIVSIIPGVGITSVTRSQPVWNIQTETFVKVATILQSPNHWDENLVGNKHWFFILEGCKNPEQTRGIYNEYLKSDFDKHRKVFEILGDKQKCTYSQDQLSGIGFSSTRSDTVLVEVTNEKYTKLYNIVF